MKINLYKIICFVEVFRFFTENSSGPVLSFSSQGSEDKSSLWKDQENNSSNINP